MNKKQKIMLMRIVVSAVLLIGLQFVPITGIPQLLCFLVVYGIIGYDILRQRYYGTSLVF